MRMPRTPRRQEPVDPHEPQHPRLARMHPVLPQPHAYLAMPFTVERAGREYRADQGDDVGVTLGGLRPPLRASRVPLPGTVAYTLDRGTCHTPRGADTASPSPDCGAGSFPQPPQVLPELFFRAGARRDRGASSSPRPSPAVAAPRAPRDQARGASAPAGHSPGTPAATLRARAPGPDSRGRPRRSPRPGRAGVRSPPSLRTPPLGEVIRSLRRHRRLCHWSAPSLSSVQRNRDRPNRDVVQFLSSRSFAFLVGSEGTGVSLEQHAVALADSRWYGPGPKRYPMCWWMLLVAVGADASNPATARAPRDRLRPGQ